MPKGQPASGIQWVLNAWSLSYRTAGQHCLNPSGAFPTHSGLASAPWLHWEVLTEVICPWPSWAWAKSTGTSRLRHRYSCLPSMGWEQFGMEPRDTLSLSPAPPAGWCLGGAGGTLLPRWFSTQGKWAPALISNFFFSDWLRLWCSEAQNCFLFH